MAKVLIVYTSRTGETTDIADLIAEGARMGVLMPPLLNPLKSKKKKTWRDMTPMSLDHPPTTGR